MKIAIIGHGFVGKSLSYAYSDQELTIIDPFLYPESEELYALLKYVDGIFISVPSPSNPDGSCDVSILESVLEKIETSQNTPIISKVTAPPNVYFQLSNKYNNLVYCPEFLTAVNSKADYVRNTNVIVGYGANIEYIVTKNTKNIINSSIKYNITETDIVTASYLKYVINSFLASKVTLMNEYAKLAEKIGVDWDEFSVYLDMDKRIGTSHLNVPGPDKEYGWGGMCFPKDIAALEYYAKDIYPLELLTHIKQLNDKHRS